MGAPRHPGCATSFRLKPAPALRNGRSEGARGVGGCLAEAFRVRVFGRLVASVAHFVRQRSHRKIERGREREGEGEGAKKRYIPAQNVYILIHIMYLLAVHHQSFFSSAPVAVASRLVFPPALARRKGSHHPPVLARAPLHPPWETAILAQRHPKSFHALHPTTTRRRVSDLVLRRVAQVACVFFSSLDQSERPAGPSARPFSLS